MNFKQLKLLLLALFTLVISSSFGMAADFLLKIEKPEVIDDLLSPGEGGAVIAKNGFKPKQWLQVDLKFKITPKNKKTKFVDRITVLWKFAVKNIEGKGYRLLEKEINHVNVPVGEDVNVSIYLSNNSIKRLFNKDKIRKGDIEQIGGEIRVNGQEVNGRYYNLNKVKKWWKSGKYSRYDKIPLLNKNETPFKNYWVDHYAEIEVKR